MPAFTRPPEPDDPALFERLALEWWPVCERWARARERRRPGRDFGSLANMALWKAAAKFDPSRGNKFPTVLRWELFAAWKMVTQPTTRWARVTPTTPAHRLPRRPPAPPVPPARPDFDFDFEGPVLMPRLPDGTPDFEGLIGGLPDRERRVLRLRFADGRTLAEVGADLGITREGVRLVQERALAALRRGAAESRPPDRPHRIGPTAQETTLA